MFKCYFIEWRDAVTVNVNVSVSVNVNVNFDRGGVRGGGGGDKGCHSIKLKGRAEGLRGGRGERSVGIA